MEATKKAVTQMAGVSSSDSQDESHRKADVLDVDADDEVVEAPRKKSKAEPAKEEKEQTVVVRVETIKSWHTFVEIVPTWENAFSPAMEAIQQSSATLRSVSGLPPNNGVNYKIPKRTADKINDAIKQFKHGMTLLGEEFQRNAKHLAPELAAKAHSAAGLQKRNQALKSQSEQASDAAAEAASAAAEAASKLQATQVALHQSAAGHSDISSTFPLSLEIAEKVKTFSASDSHTTFVLEHVIENCSTMQEAGETMRMLHTYSSDTVKHAYDQREQTMMAALGVERTPLIDGFLRKLWQAHHDTFLPTQNVEQLIISMPTYLAAESPPVIDLCTKFCSAEGPESLTPVLQNLLQLYVFTTVSVRKLRLITQRLLTAHPTPPDRASAGPADAL